MSANPARERRLLERARGGDEDAFRRLVEPYGKELLAHCYRMLGSVHDADDALQDALLRAWRGLPKFEGRSSLRSWLFRITTNACLDVISRRPKRVLPIDHGPAAGSGDDLGEPLSESVWIEPYAEDQLEDGHAAPEARYEQRESVELALIAALQHLSRHPARRADPPRRARLLRTRVRPGARHDGRVGQRRSPTRAQGSGGEAAPPEPAGHVTRARRRRHPAGRRRCIDAWERGDVDAILAMLADDATFTMPPLPTWYRGRNAIAAFLTRYALQDRWRLVPARANGQLAFGCYAWDAEREAYTALSLDVLTLDGMRAAEVTSFVTPYTLGPARERFAADVLERFGLPDRLD